jgi:hypothetical protein
MREILKRRATLPVLVVIDEVVGMGVLIWWMVNRNLAGSGAEG